MRTIHKYPFREFYEVEGSSAKHTDLMLPEGAVVLDVQLQHALITLWAEVDISKPNSKRTFVVYGTGWDMPDDIRSAMHGYCDYISTVQDPPYVWHIYEKMP